MKKAAPLKSRFHVTVPQEVMRDILKSGQTPQMWLREAAQQRVMKEHREEPPLERVERLLTNAQKHIDDLTTELKHVKHELAKLHITAMRTESQLLDARKRITAVWENQRDTSGLLGQMDENFSHAVNQLGPSLLVVLSQQLRDLIQVETAKSKEKEPKHNPRFPISDRSLYPDRNL